MIFFEHQLMCCSRKYPNPSHGGLFGWPSTPTNLSVLFHTLLQKFWLSRANPHPLPLQPGIFNTPSWGGYGYFLKPFKILYHFLPFNLLALKFYLLLSNVNDENQRLVMSSYFVTPLVHIQWNSINFFSLGGLLPHLRPCDNTLENSCFQIFK